MVFKPVELDLADRLLTYAMVHMLSSVEHDMNFLGFTLIGLGGRRMPLMFSECCSETAKAIELKLADFLHLVSVHVLR